MSDEKSRFIAEYSVSRETLDRLAHYADLTRKWSKRINLVSGTSLPYLWSRHFADSAQLVRLAEFPVVHWGDLGSGGGFPGIVVAILEKTEDRIGRMTLVESDHRKAAFLRTVIRELDLDATVLTERIQTADPLNADALSARALAPLSDLLGFAQRHLRPDGVAYFLKGAAHEKEYHEALERWCFRCETRASLTDPRAVVYRVSEIESV